VATISAASFNIKKFKICPFSVLFYDFPIKNTSIFPKQTEFALCGSTLLSTLCLDEFQVSKG